MLTVRLKPRGKNRNITYRVVVMEKRSKYDGYAIDDLGYYNPTVAPVLMSIDQKKLQHWIDHGAQITGAVRKLLSAG